MLFWVSTGRAGILASLGQRAESYATRLNPPPQIDRTTHADQLAVCGRTYSFSRRSGFTATALSMAARAKDTKKEKYNPFSRYYIIYNGLLLLWSRRLLYLFFYENKRDI
jgi:hypothetical protein